jgi:hypothetical protein
MANRKSPVVPGWIRTSLWVGGGLVLVVIVAMAFGHNPLQHLNHGMPG